MILRLLLDRRHSRSAQNTIFGEHKHFEFDRHVKFECVFMLSTVYIPSKHYVQSDSPSPTQSAAVQNDEFRSWTGLALAGKMPRWQSEALAHALKQKRIVPRRVKSTASPHGGQTRLPTTIITSSAAVELTYHEILTILTMGRVHLVRHPSPSQR